MVILMFAIPCRINNTISGEVEDENFDISQLLENWDAMDEEYSRDQK